MLTSSRVIKEAPKIWKHLNGIVNIYKPAGVTLKQVQTAISYNICRGLNELEVRPLKNRIEIEAAGEDQQSFLVKIEPNLADHVLVVGERYQIADFKSVCSRSLGKFSSGVMSINKGVTTALKLRDNRVVRVYHVTGRLGRSTVTHFDDSPVTMRASFDHVYVNKLHSLLSSLQASHQKKMFEMCGVDIQSQAAFELAAQGPLRPAVSNIPLIYSLRCIDFRKPHFTIEIHAINESEAYLGVLIHDIGLSLKTVAHCSQIRCIRQSHFTLEDSLLRRHWNLENIVNNMSHCRKIVHNHPEVLYQQEPALREEK